MLRTWTLALALTGLAATSAFAATQAPAPKNAPVNACALLKDDEVSAILGVKVLPGERRDEGNVEPNEYVKVGTYSSTCLWRVASDKTNDPTKPMNGISFAILNAMQWPKGGDDAKKFIQSFHEAAEAGVIDNKPVSLKIGDDAIWWGDGVAVRKGDRSFGISVHLTDGRPKERGMEEELAKKIAPRI
jgi:hypothetical protein